MELELALAVAVDRASDVLDHEDAGLMVVFGTSNSEYQLELIQNPIAAGVIDGMGVKLEHLKPEWVVFVVQKGEEYWVWAGNREGKRTTMKVPFVLVEEKVIVGKPTDVDTLDCLPLELFWRRE